MNKIRLTLTTFATVIFTLTISSLAQAQATRTWVSGTGDDANPCTRLEPCATFAAALALTAPGGEISVMDAGSYGPVTITKSVTINGNGTLAGILAGSNNAIVIDALTTDKIVLRGLDINGGSAGGLDGIRFLTGGSLHVEDSTITNMTNGINVGLNQAANAEVHVVNSYIRNNSNVGIFVSNAGAGTVHMGIERTTSENNAFGLLGRNNTRVMASKSIFAGNSTTGVLAEVLTAGPVAIIDVVDCRVRGNGTGLSAGNSAVVNQGNLRVSSTVISFNGTGVTAGNGTASTFADNILRDNAANGAFTLPTLGKN